MDLRLLFIICFLTISTQAQVTDLKKLSSGKFYASDEIKDNNNNIKGYFLVFESDKVAKETYELNYVVLDENLNKVTNGAITEMKFESWFRDAKYINIHVKSLYKNKLLIEMSDQIKFEKAFLRYRILDLTTNVMSDPFLYVDGKMELHPVIDRKSKNYKKNNSESMYFADGVGLMVQTNVSSKKNGLRKYLAHFTDDFTEDWRYNYQDNNVEPKLISDLYPKKSDKDVMVFWTENQETGFWGGRFYNTITILDSKTGIVRKKFEIPSGSGIYSIADCKVTADKVYVLATHMHNDIDKIGMVRFVFDKADGKYLEDKWLDWSDMMAKMPVNGHGYVDKQGYLYIHNMLMMENGKIIAVAEAHEDFPVTVGNMYFLTIGQDFNLEDVFTVEKFKNKFPGTMITSPSIKAEGGFDYIDYQNLGDDEFLFFLHDNESESVNRDKSTLYSIVSYSDGKFNKQTVNLKKEGGTTRVMNAKKGYLVFIENFTDENKPVEYRLEKVNY